MKKLFSVLALLLCILAAGHMRAADPILPIKAWTCKTKKPKPKDWDVRRGGSRIFQCTFLDYNDTAMNLSNATQVLFNYTPINPATNTTYYTITGSVYSAASGIVRATWTTASESTQDYYDYEFVVKNGSNTMVEAGGKLRLLPGVTSSATPTAPTAITSIDWAAVQESNTDQAPYSTVTTNGLATTNWVIALGYTTHTTNGLATTNWVTSLGYTTHTTNGLVSTNYAALLYLAARSNLWDTAYGWGDHSLAGYLTSIAGDATANVRMNGYSIYLDADDDTRIFASPDNQIVLETGTGGQFALNGKVLTWYDVEYMYVPAGDYIYYTDGVSVGFWPWVPVGSNAWQLWSTDIDGGGTDGAVMSVADGGRVVDFPGSISEAGTALEGKYAAKAGGLSQFTGHGGTTGQVWYADGDGTGHYGDAPSGGGSVTLTGYTLVIDTADWCGDQVGVGSLGSGSNAVVWTGYSTANATNNSLSGDAWFSSQTFLNDKYYYAFAPAPATATKLSGITVLVRSSGDGVTTNYVNLLFDDTSNVFTTNNLCSSTPDAWRAYTFTAAEINSAWTNAVPTNVLDGVSVRGLNVRCDAFLSYSQTIQCKVLFDWD